MRLRRALLSVAALVPLAAAIPPAAADDLCFGFPDVPDAFVCAVSVTPENALPSTEPGETTVWVPEFCIAVCLGPTPVDVPISALTPNSGTVLVLRYKGEEYPISTTQPLPPGFPPSVGSRRTPDGFVGTGCSMVAVENPTQPGEWRAVQAGSPVVATDPANEIQWTSCIIQADGDYVWGGGGLATFAYDGIGVVSSCIGVSWIRDGDYHYAEACNPAVPLGTARVAP